MPSKLDLEKENKLLKTQIRKLKSELKDMSSDVDGLDRTAHAAIKHEGVFKIVSVKFNIDQNKAVIDKIYTKGTGKSLTEVSSYVKKEVVDELIKENKK